MITKQFQPHGKYGLEFTDTNILDVEGTGPFTMEAVLQYIEDVKKCSTEMSKKYDQWGIRNKMHGDSIFPMTIAKSFKELHRQLEADGLVANVVILDNTSQMIKSIFEILFEETFKTCEYIVTTDEKFGNKWLDKKLNK